MAETMALRDLPRLFEEGLALPRFTISGVLPSEGVTVLFGPSGVGKTGLTVATAMAVAAGDDWAGRDTTPGGVMYVAAEDCIGVRARLHVAAAMRGGHGLPIVIAGRLDASLTSDRGLKELHSITEHHSEDLEDLALIIVDTVATVFGDGSQDDARDVSAFMNSMHDLAAQHGAAVLVIHHTGKTGPQLRGSQVFEDRADAVLQVSRSARGPVVKVAKQRNGESGAMFAFDIAGLDVKLGGEIANIQIVKNLRELTSDNTPVEPNAMESQETDRDLMLRVLEELVSDVSGHVSGNISVSVSDWKTACFEAWPHKTERTKSSTFSKHSKLLRSQKKITVRGKNVSIPVSGNIGNETGNIPPVVSVSVSTPLFKEGGTETGNGISEIGSPVRRSAGGRDAV